MDKKMWKQPDMQIQTFAANEYVAVCQDNEWTEKGCVGNTYGETVWFSNKNINSVSDNVFTFSEFDAVKDWNSHAKCEGNSPNPNNKVLYMLESWKNAVSDMITNAKKDPYTYNPDTVIDEQYWGIGYHPGNSGHHIYDEVFYESHS